MLVWRCVEGQVVEVTHRSGDVLSIAVSEISRNGENSVELGFHDNPQNFRFAFRASRDRMPPIQTKHVT